MHTFSDFFAIASFALFFASRAFCFAELELTVAPDAAAEGCKELLAGGAMGNALGWTIMTLNAYVDKAGSGLRCGIGLGRAELGLLGEGCDGAVIGLGWGWDGAGMGLGWGWDGGGMRLRPKLR